MNVTNELNNSIINLLYYLIIPPFLKLSGLGYYNPAVADFFKYWLYLAMGLIIAYLFIVRFHIVKSYSPIIPVFFYYFTYLIITIVIQGTPSEGIQKLYAAPALFLFSLVALEGDSKNYLKSITNIIIIELFLDVLFLIIRDYRFNGDESHYLFSGHIQTASQIGILFITLFILNRYYVFNNHKRIMILGVISSIVIMVASGTSSSLLVLIILAALYILSNRLKLYVVTSNTNLIFIIYIVLNFALFIASFLNGNSYSLFGLTLHGRGFIWYAAMEKILQRPWFGYGVHGTKFVVFWSAWRGDGSGLNYTHNDIIQELLDGGITLLILYIIKIISFLKSNGSIVSDKQKQIVNFLVIAFLLVMTFDTAFLYYYVIFFLCIIYYWPVYTTQ